MERICSRKDHLVPLHDFYSGQDSWCKSCRKDYVSLMRRKRSAAIEKLKSKDEFGFVPKSVFKTNNPKDWNFLIGDDGRFDTLSGQYKKYSVFPADLSEMCVKIWSEKGDLILDPFAGRGTRGVVSLVCGRRYVGYDISPLTCELLDKKVASIGGVIYKADGCTLEHTDVNSVDYILTSPPYPRAEKYESVPGQLSDIVDYDKFLSRIAECLSNSYKCLKSGKFATFVVGDSRDTDGSMFPFHSDVIQNAKAIGFKLWDEIILDVGSPFIRFRANDVFEHKHVCKVHEYVITFRKV